MSFEWINITLGNFLNLKRGYDLPKKKRKDGDIPIISSSGYSGVHDISMAKGPGVVTGRYGTIGEVFYIPENFWPLNTTLYVEDFKGNSPLFSYYLLQTIDFHAYSDKAAVPGINRNHVHMASIRVPNSIIAQEKIASILKKLEDKITSNKKINHTLEQIAQALFKSWFVDFEPVKAKIVVLEAGGSLEDATLATMAAISGKDADALMAFEREHPEQYAELKSTAELFPSAMQNSELGEIPEGWCHGPLSDIATFANGKVDVCSLTPETYISTENMLENRAGISTASSLPSVNSVPEFRCGHVLISNIRPYFKKIWLARFKGGRSADVLAFEALDAVTVEYLYNLLYQEAFFNFMMLTSKGVKMPRGDKNAIMGWQCVHPDKKISNVFSKAVGEYYSFIEINNAQNKTLTQLRDTLLPKLLSGEITLPDTEQGAREAENV
ncbi:Predicted nucleotidyltransferases [Serratia marcescens]|uniref:restriction endonuclease subunit S n=1 Tax=Serratia TaxID=613 RepID=UPI0007456125|nr:MULTISPECIES: restriction endonuclease subunit S [Serratia]MBI6171457.1 restriction endonuclease subunit S [Serratia marcescens]MDY0766535.1 restriction endonuclease subunit S [Serratia nevei]MED6025228.1 restriction endonuclease subunit S [Serratia marcescens]CUZ20245.1 Predicted nucleotidyltransferases [Serratia marcescens]CUZ38187.1 Predicted nucleotidyltransferases [Serratia marcescens]